MTTTITDRTSSRFSASSPRYVFVYGTLRKGEERDINRLLPTPTFIGTSQIQGTLYHLGACNYPGLRLGGSTWVQGDVYQITPELERQLDDIEHVFPVESAEYARREINLTVRTAPDVDRELACLTYEISAQRAIGMTVIASGNWLDR